VSAAALLCSFIAGMIGGLMGLLVYDSLRARYLRYKHARDYRNWTGQKAPRLRPTEGFDHE
jgi:hypothetical protein